MQGIHKKDHFRALPGNVRNKILKANESMKDKRNEYQWDRECKAIGHPRRHEFLLTGGNRLWSHSEGRAEATALAAMIPSELANCIADYAERLVGTQCAVDVEAEGFAKR